MINDKLIELHKELDRTILEADQSRGLYLGLTFDDYQILKTKESEISRSSKIKKASLEEVFSDIKRNGVKDIQILTEAFVFNTDKKSRIAYNFGYEGLVVYFATGTYINNKNLELGLISAHKPGNSGGGGWGLNGTRKLQLTEKSFWKTFNPDRWMKNSVCCAHEHHYGKIHYDTSMSKIFKI